MQIQYLNIPRATKKSEQAEKNFKKNLPAFVDLPKADHSALQKFAKQIKDHYGSVLILGIGGSTLGAQTLTTALTTNYKLPTINYLDNLDPQEISTTFSKLNWKKTLVLVVSKSGGTLETLAQFFVVKNKLGKSWKKHTIFITDPTQGFLRELAQKEKIPCFDVPPAIGGRFSVLSAVGLLPAAINGINIQQLLKGAQAVEIKSALTFAQHHAAIYKSEKNITVFCPYSAQLKKLGEWYAQLLAESIGKTAKIGITPEVSIGAADQHSKLQLWMDGPADKFFIFLGLEKFQTDYKISTPAKEFAYLKNKTLGKILNIELEATVQALAEKKRPLVQITLPKLNAFNLGYLLQFFMLEVALLGEILDVNAYNQPGVERGKVLAKARF